MSKQREEDWKESFIDRNIGELAKDYAQIFGANINIARITPEIIDGLKPVQRRAIYIMFLKDKGKTKRKLASISGDTFGRIHPHAPTSIDDAVVGLEQPWHNNIPLIKGYGNWGTCHVAGTEVLTVCGWKDFKDITMKDLLASVDPDTKEIIYENPTNIIGYRYTGNIVSMEDPDNNVCFKVTPDHTMIIAQKGSKFYQRKAFQLPPYIELMNYHDMNNNIVIDNVDELVKRELYDGMVYCATVPTHHTLITKLNDCILISGNCNGDPNGAPRYIYATLSEYASECFFDEWKDSVVDMVLGADEDTYEPLYLPSKYPNVLINGCLGIGYGLSSNIPPFNFKEVVNACIALMHNPNANIVLIPDSPTGASIIEGNFSAFANGCSGAYTMRCTYDVDAENNIVTITSVPYLIKLNDIRYKIAEMKSLGGLPGLVDMNDLTDTSIKLQLLIRDDVNPYKFMKKLIKSVAGLEKSYPVTLTVTNDFETFDYSVKEILLRWIQFRRENKRLTMNNRRTNLLTEQRTNDVKIFLLGKDNLNKVQTIFRTGRNRKDIEQKLVDTYRHSEIRMDSLMARTLSDMRMIDLSIDAYENCLRRREELAKDIAEVEDILRDEDGIDKVIIAELRDGVKRFGTPRRSSVVPYDISTGTDVAGMCILQLSSDGMITRKTATNVDGEPVPTDSNGFAVVVDNDSSFVVIDELAHHSFIRVKDLPVDAEVPINRYSKQNIYGDRIVAMLPVDIDNPDMCCTIISRHGQLKRIKISDIGPSKKPIISLADGDRLVRGIVTKIKTAKDILVFTKNGMGQRFDPNAIRITSPLAKGGNGFKLKDDDEIIGCYAINPEENQYVLYMTAKGKARLNLLEYLPQRDSKHDAMLNLISLNDRDKLVSVVGCNKMDRVQIFFDDGSDEIIEVKYLPESTMSSDPKKVTSKNAVTTNVVKVKIL